MPKKTKTSKVTVQPKRHGSHHRHSKQYRQVYWPFLPMLLIVLALGVTVTLLNFSSPRRVLSYATEMSHISLLEATNKQRIAHKASTLTLNEKLNKAAQAKADDMAARNYWSHTTPDGREPWYFIDQAGYSYLKAGENLAYGFATSSNVVSGWMNSQTHRENLLDSSYSEVGFGIANAENYQSDGKETIVVAMYAKPQQIASRQDNSNPANEVSTVPSNELPSKPVARVEAMSNGNLPWAMLVVGASSGSAVTGLLLSHGLRLRKFIKKGEKFFYAHPLLDLSLLGIALLGIELTRTVGFIR